MGVSEPSKTEAVKTITEKTSSFEDLLDLSGSSGWRNVFIFLISSYATMISALGSFNYQFLGGTPDHWCNVDALNGRNLTLQQVLDISIPFKEINGIKEYSKCEMFNINYDILDNFDTFETIYAKTQEFRHENSSVTCGNRFFNSSVETVVTKWDLVCESRAIYSTTQAAVYAGTLIGSPIFGFLVDRFGRALIYKICAVLYVISGFLTCFSFSIVMFIALKMFNATFAMGMYMAGFVTVMEITPTSKRTMLGNYFVIPWAFGMMTCAAICYMVRPWQSLQAALTAPSLLLLFSFWILPESPRWLILNGKYDAAYDVLDVISKSNKNTFPPRAEMIAKMEKIHKMNTKEEDPNKKDESIMQKMKNILTTISCLVVNSQLRWMTLALFFCWFSVSMVYYGVSLGSTALSTDPYLYIFLGGVLELISYLLLWPVVTAMGRKRAVVMFFWVCAFSILSVMTMVILVEKNNYAGLKTTLFLAGKFSITAGFHLLWVFTAELYPTNIRSLALGESSTMARFGSLCSPYINDILGESTPWAPAALFGSLSVIAGLIGCSLQDTSGTNLTDSLEEKEGKEEFAINPAFEEDVENSTTPD